MGLVGRALKLLLIVFAVWIGFHLLGWALHLVVGAVVLAVQLGILAGLVLLGYAGWRRLTRRGRRRRHELRPASKSLDLDFIRGRIDKETYLRNERAKRLS